MRYKKKKPPEKVKRLSKIFTDDQFFWVKKIYPHVPTPELAQIIFEHLGIRITPKSIENLAYRNNWYKTENEISEVRSKNAISTNQKRWGYYNG